jgi:hypothetical protein
MLAVVARFKWRQITYLKALEEHFDVRVAWSGEGGRGAGAAGIREGLRSAPIGSIPEVGVTEVRSRLEQAIAEASPDLVHLMYYKHDQLTLIARELSGEEMPLVYECRDPQTTLSGAAPGSEQWDLERRALEASDAQIFVSRAVREYFERSHALELEQTSLIVPQCFARATIAPPSPKLSAEDGRVHIALVGTADDAPDHGRWYVEIIRRLVSLGLVVHSHFFEPPRFDMGDLRLDAYHELDEKLEDYHFHPAVLHRQGTVLSELVSRYDLMGVFHELGASHHNESATLTVCLPTKAVCGWLHAGIPVVCLPHYRGVIEWIDALGIGFVIERWEDLREIAADREAIAAATERCLACRDRFTAEHNAARIRNFVDPLLAGDAAIAAGSRPPSPRLPS